MFGAQLFPQPVAVAIGSDRVWFAYGKAGAITTLPAYIARNGSRAVAIGDEAVKLVEAKTPGVTLTCVTAQGGLSDGALATGFLRTALTAKGRMGFIVPKLVVACAHQARFEVVKAFESVGIKSVITLPPAMAAALGAGLAVSEPGLKFSFLLDRDWCSFMVISQNASVASFEVPGGIDQLLEDFAIQQLAGGGPAVDLETLRRSFSAQGLSPADLGTGGNGTGRNVQPFALRLERRYRLALQKVDAAKVAEAPAAPIHLFGPYANVPGVAELVALAFARPVTVPKDPEKALVRGVQWVIGDLANLIKRPRKSRKLFSR